MEITMLLPTHCTTINSAGTAKNRNLEAIPNMDGTYIQYAIPGSYTVSSDSTVFEATIRNGVNSAEMRMVGNISEAGVSFSAPANGVGSYNLWVGSVYKTITVSPAIDFTSYNLVQFAIKGTKAFLYINNKLITSFSFSATNRIGNVQLLSMGYKGYIECDKVRLLNSYTKKVRMKEEFNIDGKSRTIFY